VVTAELTRTIRLRSVPRPCGRGPTFDEYAIVRFSALFGLFAFFFLAAAVINMFTA
jgi:hypothetical protein